MNSSKDSASESSIALLQSLIADINHEVESALKEIRELKQVEDARLKFLGRKGPIQALMLHLKQIPVSDKPLAGKLVNDLKEKVENSILHLSEKLCLLEEASRIEQESIDISLPGRRKFLGRRHPVLQMQDKVLEVLISMGFSVQYGPDIESDYYNFEALNYPKDHPARDMQDTFYISPDILLRTHTTNIQIRIMEMIKPPIRIICPGNVYRNEEVTARSHVFFHQVDGLYIDKGVTFADLLATLEQFYAKLFGDDIRTRVRASYFPFVEPGLEVDILCVLCKGKGCSTCKHTGWLEVAGAGMVHPEVLKNSGIDPEEYSGYAWGMGIERLVMVQKGISDIRMFTENDMRFLQQFP
ncbi:MAG: phenylalanine--tRNA ligase subunit alpha [Chlamydiales bacterium]|nr:phenylalanine--tRNA ligase subunit alpha [Chlamydiales bacterium]